eukprot:9481234-Pyramimonas_sp.AAC.1
MSDRKYWSSKKHVNKQQLCALSPRPVELALTTNYDVAAAAANDCLKLGNVPEPRAYWMLQDGQDCVATQ